MTPVRTAWCHLGLPAERLDAPITVLPNGGHFLGSEGVLELPAAKSLLDQLRGPHGGSGWPQYSPGACTV